MKSILKKIYGKVMYVPLLGYLLQIIVGIVKLPLVKYRMEAKYSAIDSKLAEIDDKLSRINNELLQKDSRLSQLFANFDNHEAKLVRIEVDLPAVINMLNSANSVIRLYKRELTDLSRKLDEVSSLHNVN